MQTLLQRHTEMWATPQKTRCWRGAHLHTHSDTCTQAYVYRRAQRHPDTTEQQSYVNSVHTDSHTHTHTCLPRGIGRPEGTQGEGTLERQTSQTMDTTRESGFQPLLSFPRLLHPGQGQAWELPAWGCAHASHTCYSKKKVWGRFGDWCPISLPARCNDLPVWAT